MGDAESRAFDVEWEAQFEPDSEPVIQTAQCAVCDEEIYAGKYNLSLWMHIGGTSYKQRGIARHRATPVSCGHRWIECPDGFIDQDDRWHGCPDCDP